MKKSHIFISVVLATAVLSGIIYFLNKDNNKTVPSNSCNMLYVDTYESKMMKAMEDARKSLPHFWEVFDNRKNKETEFILQIILTDGEENNYVWLDDIKRQGKKIYGKVANDDFKATFGKIDTNTNKIVPLKDGELIEFTEADIYDWGYTKNDKLYGHFGERVRLADTNNKRLLDKALKYMLSEKPY